MSLRNPKQAGEWLNREKVINFTFEGEAFAAFEGDTISSALWAAGIKVLGRCLVRIRRAPIVISTKR